MHMGGSLLPKPRIRIALGMAHVCAKGFCKSQTSRPWIWLLASLQTHAQDWPNTQVEGAPCLGCLETRHVHSLICGGCFAPNTFSAYMLLLLAAWVWWLADGNMRKTSVLPQQWSVTQGYHMVHRCAQAKRHVKQMSTAHVAHKKRQAGGTAPARPTGQAFCVNGPH